MISLKALLKEENFTAINKESGKTSVFKTKDHRDAAIKAGTHSEKKDDTEKEEPKGDKPNMFSKDSGYDAPDTKSDNKTDSSSDDQTEAADAVLTAINNIPGRRIIRLNRKNRNGKIIQDVEFGSDEITNELIQSTAKEYGIDLNDVIKFGLDKKIKTPFGSSNLKETIQSLVLDNAQLKQYAPDGIAPNENQFDKIAKKQKEKVALINKASKPKADKTPNPANSIDSYSESEVKNTKDKLNKNPGVFTKENNKKFTEKEIADFANKYKVDVNRILDNAQTFTKFTNISDEELDGETAEEFVAKALSNTIYDATKNNRSGMSWLDNLKKVYPLKSKSLSDADWQSGIDDELKNPTTVSGRILKFTKEQNELNKNWSDNANLTKKSQSSWVTEQYKDNPKYVSTMLNWQKMISKNALREIDEILISSPPPPVKAEALYRGMAMTSADLKQFLGNFPEGSDVKLPIGSFSLNPTIATDFSDSTATDNMIVNKDAKQAVIIKIVNSKNEFNGFSMNANIDNTEGKSKGTFDNVFSDWSSQEEVLMPSNNKYKALKTETVKVKGGRSFTTITMEAIVATNEIKLKELIDYKERDILKRHLQYPQKRLD